ncbi:hypothetical protein, partial [Capnocytophaga catalasegens]
WASLPHIGNNSNYSFKGNPQPAISVATTTVTEAVEEDTSNIDDFCFNEGGFQYTQLGLACKKGDFRSRENTSCQRC